MHAVGKSLHLVSYFAHSDKECQMDTEGKVAFYRIEKRDSGFEKERRALEPAEGSENGKRAAG